MGVKFCAQQTIISREKKERREEREKKEDYAI
jgi:hypothetical protein